MARTTQQARKGKAPREDAPTQKKGMKKKVSTPTKGKGSALQKKMKALEAHGQKSPKNRSPAEGKPSPKKIADKGPKKPMAKSSKPVNGKPTLKRKSSDQNPTDKPAKKKWQSLGKKADSSDTTKEKVKFRKKFQNNFDNVQALKALWEELRQHKIEPKKRDELCKKMMKILKGHVKEYLFAHDSSRIVQSLFKFGTTELKDALFAEMKDSIGNIMKSKYAKFLIKKIIKYGSKPQKRHILNSLNGNMTKLVRHSYASEVVDYLYSEYCTSTERTGLIAEFFGPSFSLFKALEPQTLEQILAKEPAQKETVLRDMKKALSTMTEKSVIQHSIVHKLFLEYFCNASEEAKTECVESLRDVLVHVVHTRDGSALARHVLWYGNAKDRKAMVRSLKGNVVKLCCDEQGHTVILALLDCVDDTALLSTVILKEMEKNVTSLAADACGRRVLLYILHRRDPRFCTPALARMLESGDDNANSKKPAATRAAELLGAASPWLLKHVISHVEDMFKDSPQLVLLTTVLCFATKGDVRGAMSAVARQYCEPFVALEHPVERSPTQLALKHLITADAQRDEEQEKFAVILMEELPEGELKKWCTCNRGCFTCWHLLETKLDAVQTRVKNELQSEKSTIEKISHTKGAELLLKML